MCIIGRGGDGNTAVAPAVEIGGPVRENFQFREGEADLVVYQCVLGGFRRAYTFVILRTGQDQGYRWYRLGTIELELG